MHFLCVFAASALKGIQIVMSLKLCLAGSGGGHVRQLLDLEPVWRRFDYVFVTEDTSLGRSLAMDHPVKFVAHYAIGQARLGKPLKMLGGALRNLLQSVRIIATERPDVVISSGAGAVFWVAVLGRLFGAKLIVLESFARFDKPSKFGRLVSPFATKKIVQAPALKKYWPDAELFDPFRVVEGERPPKKPLLFATVGATLPFERLVDTVIAAKSAGHLPYEIVLQTGSDPRSLPSLDGVRMVESLDFQEVQQILRDAEMVLCHGGTGSLVTALRAGCKTMAMPRRFDLAEHYDDHQEEVTTAFAERGLIDIVNGPEDLEAAIARGKNRPAVMATTDHSALIQWLDKFLDGIRDARVGV